MNRNNSNRGRGRDKKGRQGICGGRHRLRLWFAKIAIGIQIKELADPPRLGLSRMILI
jgi:hypothetical protein